MNVGLTTSLLPTVRPYNIFVPFHKTEIIGQADRNSCEQTDLHRMKYFSSLRSDFLIFRRNFGSLTVASCVHKNSRLSWSQAQS